MIENNFTIRNFRFLQTTTQNEDKTQPDYIRINSQWAKSIPKVRKTMSEEVVEKVREKKDNELRAYHEQQKGRVPDQ